MHSPVTITIREDQYTLEGEFGGESTLGVQGLYGRTLHAGEIKTIAGWTPLKPLLGLNTTAVSISTVSRGKANTLLFVVLSTQMSTQG